MGGDAGDVLWRALVAGRMGALPLPEMGGRIVAGRAATGEASAYRTSLVVASRKPWFVAGRVGLWPQSDGSVG